MRWAAILMLWLLSVPVGAQPPSDDGSLVIRVTSDRPGQLFVRCLDEDRDAFKLVGQVGREPFALRVSPNQRFDLEVRGRLDLFRFYSGRRSDVSGGMHPEIRTDIEVDWVRITAVPVLLTGMLALWMFRRSKQLERKGQMAAFLATEAISRARRAEARSGDPIRIGRYRVVQRLGQGGMAKVYEVEDDYGDHFALKVPDHTSPRFQREWDILRNCNHPGIVRLYDFEVGTDDSPAYLVMELLEGQTLAQRLQRGALPIKAAVNIARHLLEVLDYTHQRGIIHRDLSASNVFLLEDESLKVVDFGISKSYDLKGLTATGEVLGTPAYAAPEQVESLRVDERADLYSTGVLLYEMLTGRLPWEATDPVQLFLKKSRERPRPPGDLRPEIPEPLSKLILDLLEIQPDRRPGSAGEVLERLDW